jgi:hypothetical protein
VRRCLTCGNTKPRAVFAKPGASVCRRGEGRPPAKPRGRSMPRPLRAKVWRTAAAEELVTVALATSASGQ